VAAGRAAWRKGMALMADERNVVAKISGLGMFNHICNAATVTPILREMVNMFGAERCLFGSNFPVDKPWVSYGDMIAAYRQAAAGYNQVRRSAIFHDTAARIYRL
jgi:predicted TIM-barrel fold metal-dependent hydrolase